MLLGCSSTPTDSSSDQSLNTWISQRRTGSRRNIIQSGGPRASFVILKRPLKLFTVKRITRSGLSNLSSCPNCCRVMAFWPTDRRQSLSSLYEKIHKEDESDNLWASLLKGLFNLIQRKMYLRITYCIQSVLIYFIQLF